MIAAAKQLAPEIDFRVGDAEALDFGDAAFEAITSTFGVMLVVKPEALAPELTRAVRAGGCLALATSRLEITIVDLIKMVKPLCCQRFRRPLPKAPRIV